MGLPGSALRPAPGHDRPHDRSGTQRPGLVSAYVLPTPIASRLPDPTRQSFRLDFVCQVLIMFGSVEGLSAGSMFDIVDQNSRRPPSGSAEISLAVRQRDTEPSLAYFAWARSSERLPLG